MMEHGIWMVRRITAAVSHRGETLEPYQYSVSCPKCGKEASREDYQRVEGGSLNSYLRTQCSHCGYAADTGDYDD